MCGAYGISVKKIQDLIDRFDIVNALEDFKPRWNIRPWQENPVIVNHGNNEIEYMLWGLLPQFAKEENYKHKPIKVARAHPAASCGVFEWNKFEIVLAKITENLIDFMAHFTY